jgi:hypothetical protein
MRVRNFDASAAHCPSSKTHLFNNIDGSFSTAEGPIPERSLARGGSPSKRDAEREKRFEAKLHRQARQRGYQLVPIEEKPARNALNLKGHK